jgi:hypothetical protein
MSEVDQHPVGNYGGYDSAFIMPMIGDLEDEGQKKRKKKN